MEGWLHLARTTLMYRDERNAEMFRSAAAYGSHDFAAKFEPGGTVGVISRQECRAITLRYLSIWTVNIIQGFFNSCLLLGNVQCQQTLLVQLKQLVSQPALCQSFLPTPPITTPLSVHGCKGRVSYLRMLVLHLHARMITH